MLYASSDELGFVPFSQSGAQMLFGFISQRYQRGSLIITTNLAFAEWMEVFGDPRLTSALGQGGTLLEDQMGHFSVVKHIKFFTLKMIPQFAL